MMPAVQPPARRAVTLAVTSGKGGVGKSSVVVNLAVALAHLRQRVAVLDADFGLGNVDVLLGLTPSCHLGDLLAGAKDIRQITTTGPLGVQIIPAGSGLRELTALTAVQWQRLHTGIDTLKKDLDYLLIDTAAGISSNVVDLLTISDTVMIVTSLEPTAIVDAYAVVKIVTSCSRTTGIGVLVNGARDGDEAALVFQQLDIAAQRFLHRGLEFFGFIEQDAAVREAVLNQRPVVDYQPQAPASRGFRILASRVIGRAGSAAPVLRVVSRGPGSASGVTPGQPATSGVPECA